MLVYRDPYALGYALGLAGHDLPDEVLSLFAWVGWMEGQQMAAETLQDETPTEGQARGTLTA